MTALGYSNWLKEKKYSDNTVRNYLSDLTKFSTWLKNSDFATPSTRVEDFFTEKAIITYLNGIYQEKYYDRCLASLRSYCQYCLDQNIIHKDIVSQALSTRHKLGNSENLAQDELLAEFNRWLIQNKSSPNTIKSYLSDVREFLKVTNV